MTRGEHLHPETHCGAANFEGDLSNESADSIEPFGADGNETLASRWTSGHWFRLVHVIISAELQYLFRDHQIDGLEDEWYWKATHARFMSNREVKF